MKNLAVALTAVICSTVLVLAGAPAAAGAAASPAWHMNATIIEACSCPMFCQCYFNASPAGEHAGHMEHGQAGHYCKFNNAYRVNKGSFGDVKLDGTKFWLAGDLGGDFTKGFGWAVLTFDRATSKEQRDAIDAILKKNVMAGNWGSWTTAEGDISWTANKDDAKALLDGGKTGEVVLKRSQGMTDDPIVIKNLKYWGAQRNDGFILMPNVIEAYRGGGDKTFEYKGTNGFMITFDTGSEGAAAKKAGK
jgi:Protein of unknown function (DUF1326)